MIPRHPGPLERRLSPAVAEVAHKLAGMVAAFSTADSVASELEDHTAQGRIEEARPLVVRIE